MPVARASEDELDALGRLIHRWAAGERAANDLVLAVDHLPPTPASHDRRWFIRLRGEEKAVTTVWLHLRELTLHYETQFMPAPEENRERLFEYLLRLNARLFSVKFAIGDEEAIYLVGQLPWSAVDEDELDRIVGSAYAYTEQYFAPAMGLGFGARFRAPPTGAPLNPRPDGGTVGNDEPEGRNGTIRSGKCEWGWEVPRALSRHRAGGKDCAAGQEPDTLTRD